MRPATSPKKRIAEGRYVDAQNILGAILEDRYDPRNKRAVIMLAKLETPDYYNKTIGPQFRASVEQVKQTVHRSARLLRFWAL